MTREQRAVVASDAHALEVRAGAGAGKTLTLAHRVARFAPDARAQSRTLVVTFTREATHNLERRLSLLLGRDHRVAVRSFHQWAARDLPSEERIFMPERDARRIVRDVITRAAPSPGFARALGVSPTNLDDLAQRVLGVLSFAKNAETSLAGAIATTHAALEPWEYLLEKVEATYESRKGDRLDFDDLIILFRDRLRSSRTFREEVRAKYDHVFVDEYQDVNGIQADTVHLVTKDDGPRVTVVGDVRQAIYGFRGGDPKHLERFLAPYGRKGKRLALRTNFRAARALVDAANAVLPDVDAMRPRPAAPRGTAIDMVENYEMWDEAAEVADRVERLLATGTDPREIAILSRARYLSNAIQEDLISRSADDSWFDATRLDATLDAFKRFRREARSRRRLTGLADNEQSAARAQASSVLDDPRALLSLFGTLPWDAAEIARGASIMARRGRVASLPSRFAASRLAQLGATPGLDRVTYATIHAAKGLEWDHVFLMGAREGGLPSDHVLNAPESVRERLLEEERRLTYVALTRARTSFTASWTRWNGRRECEPCRFLVPFLARPPVSPPLRAAATA